jgi:hypothetical protein
VPVQRTEEEGSMSKRSSRSASPRQPLGIRSEAELLTHRELECLRAEGARHRNRDRISVRRRKYLEVVAGV